jgi:hypothetical protein
VDQQIVKERIMKLTKTDIVEYIVAFIGIVGVLAYLHATAEPHQMVGAAQASPMTIDAGWTIRADAAHSAVRFHELVLDNTRV